MDVSAKPPQLTSGLTAAAHVPAALAADDGAEDRFRDALNSSAFGNVPSSPPAASVEPAGGETLGDAILSGVSRLTSDFQQAWSKKNEALAGDMSTWSMGQFMQFQGHVLTASTTLDLVGKGVSKVVQGVEQLTKIQ